MCKITLCHVLFTRAQLAHISVCMRVSTVRTLVKVPAFRVLARALDWRTHVHAREGQKGRVAGASKPGQPLRTRAGKGGGYGLRTCGEEAEGGGTGRWEVDMR